MIQFLIKTLQGSLIGLGAVLPGISGGVLCVIFGIYKPVMELLADPVHKYKTHIKELLPVILGCGIGFLGIANVLSLLLEKYPAQSVCVFIGLIGGMMPSLFREAGEQGRSRASDTAMYIAMALTFGLLAGLEVFSVQIMPDFTWYIFCGFCLALSIIAPGMSFSTLLMPLGLYEPFVEGIGQLDFSILVPAGIGCLATVVLLSRTVNAMFVRHYSVAFHAIIGIVIAATVMIIPFASFTVSATGFIINIFCIGFGMGVSFLCGRYSSFQGRENHV